MAGIVVPFRGSGDPVLESASVLIRPHPQQAAAGVLDQRLKVNPHFLVAELVSQSSRQHSRIGRLDLTGDDGHDDARDGRSRWRRSRAAGWLRLSASAQNSAPS